MVNDIFASLMGLLAWYSLLRTTLVVRLLRSADESYIVQCLRSSLCTLSVVSIASFMPEWDDTRMVAYKKARDR
jgi:hypothetical protein